MMHPRHGSARADRPAIRYDRLWSGHFLPDFSLVHVSDASPGHSRLQPLPTILPNQQRRDLSNLSSSGIATQPNQL
jgi:hypothetical protein